VLPLTTLSRVVAQLGNARCSTASQVPSAVGLATGLSTEAILLSKTEFYFGDWQVETEAGYQLKALHTDQEKQLRTVFVFKPILA